MSSGDSLQRLLAGVEPAYEIPVDDLVGEVLIPAMSVAENVSVGAGFFTSHCLAQIAPGLAQYIQKEGRLQVLAGTELEPEDREAIEQGLKAPQRAVDSFAVSLLMNAESALARHTADCLGYLVARNRLEIRFVLMPIGTYHKKLWLFLEGQTCLAVHGSGNATARGLLVNGEQMTIDRPWMDGESSRRRVASFERQFTQQWENKHEVSLTVEPKEMLEFLRNRGEENSSPPTVEDFWAAWRADHARGLEPRLPPGILIPSVPRRLQIPSWLVWDSGPFAHQAEAVSSLHGAGGSGILAIATGGGKTSTGLIAATQFQDRTTDPALLIVLVPSKPLALQWQEDVKDFGLSSVMLSGPSPQERAKLLEEVAASLQGEERTEVIVATYQLFFQNDELRHLLRSVADRATTILIADEVHNLGAPSYAAELPEEFRFRIGLSATPVRQYDPDGTDRLFDFFSADGSVSEQVFLFTLDDAIASGCLVPYDYWVHPVLFSTQEMDRYRDLTARLGKAGLRVDDDGRVIATLKIDSLLRERRALIEQADGKVGALRTQLTRLGLEKISRTLVYTSAKVVRFPHEGRQIDHVTELLSDLGILSHQFTNAETSKAAAESLLEKFGRGEYQVLTAMKVLDEGIDIPQTDRAFLLASSTVKREWIQRRGRILRSAEGKERADLHDFVVVPDDPATDDGKRLLRSEIARVEHFARSSANEFASRGPMEIVKEIESGKWRHR